MIGVSRLNRLHLEDYSDEKYQPILLSHWICSCLAYLLQLRAIPRNLSRLVESPMVADKKDGLQNLSAKCGEALFRTKPHRLAVCRCEGFRYVPSSPVMTAQQFSVRQGNESHAHLLEYARRVHLTIQHKNSQQPLKHLKGCGRILTDTNRSQSRHTTTKRPCNRQAGLTYVYGAISQAQSVRER